jgi:YVTN family beta-propeller protein
VFVTNSGSGTVSVINTATDTVTATIGVGDSPYGVAVSPTTGDVYVTNLLSDTVSVLSG